MLCLCMQSGRAACRVGGGRLSTRSQLCQDNDLSAMLAERGLPLFSIPAHCGADAEAYSWRRVAVPCTTWVDGRLSVRFPLRRGADLSAVLAEVAAQLGGGGPRKGRAGPGPPEGGVPNQAGADAGCPALEGEVVAKACAHTPWHSS